MWHFVWEGNPHVARPGEQYTDSIGYVNGVREYIESHTREQYVFREYRPHPAHIAKQHISPKLAARAAGKIVFNPTIKDRAPPNKQWGLDKWKSLLALGASLPWLRIGEHEGGPRYGGSDFVPTRSFWDAVSVIAGARAVVCHEGALHHAAAALGVPCVVIRGGFISPMVTGYAGQTDLYVEDARYPLGCGVRVPCAHCREAMASIAPADVLTVLRRMLEPVAA